MGAKDAEMKELEMVCLSRYDSGDQAKRMSCHMKR